MQIFRGCVLFWYVDNLTAQSAGEKGLLRVVRNRFDDAAQITQRYFKKSRKRTRKQTRQENFQNRRELGLREQPGVIADELYTIRKVTLRNRDGEIIDPSADKKSPLRRASRYRQRENAGKLRGADAIKRQHGRAGPDDHAEPAPRFKVKSRSRDN